MPDPRPHVRPPAELEQLEARLRELLRSADLDPGGFDRLQQVFDEERAVQAGAESGSKRPAEEGSTTKGSTEKEPVEWEGMIYACRAMADVRALVEKYAPASAPVLIHGESGTGKDLIARAIHALSPRRSHKLVSENCAAIPETLMESTLFGHTKGAFTGAVRDHDGHFVTAHKGTLFLDEIGDMPLAMQAKLLRALQEGEVRPVGGTRTRKVDVRVVAATHQDLEAMVRDGRFREDLFYRLNVLRLELPALRDRGEDAVLLARRLLAQADRSGRLTLGAKAEERIRQARWPGNIRQLMNEVQRIAALADGPEVGAEDFSPELRSG